MSDEARALVAQLLALAPFVSDERRERLRRLLKRLQNDSGVHGVGAGADFSGMVCRKSSVEHRVSLGASFSGKVGGYEA